MANDDSNVTISEHIDFHIEGDDIPEDGLEDYQQAIEEGLAELRETYKERIELLEEQVALLEGSTVHTAVVKRVLLEYGISRQQVEEIVETIETVDRQVWESTANEEGAEPQ